MSKGSLREKEYEKKCTYNSVHLVDVGAVVDVVAAVVAVGFVGLVAQLVAFPVALCAVDTSKKNK